MSLADEGYESDNNTADLLTPLQKTPHIHHISSMEHTSFDSAYSTPHRPVTTPLHTPTRPVLCHLSFYSDHESNTTPMQVDISESDQDAKPESSDEEEDFPTVPIDDEHWTTGMVPERTFCIHENGLPNNVCHYPCPYGDNNTTSYMDSLDLSNISDYKDYMLTTSDEEILPGLEEVPY